MVPVQAGLGTGCHWEAAGTWLAVTGRMRVVTIPSACVCYGLRLPSDCLASSGGEPQQSTVSLGY